MGRVAQNLESRRVEDKVFARRFVLCECTLSRAFKAEHTGPAIMTQATVTPHDEQAFPLSDLCHPEVPLRPVGVARRRVLFQHFRHLQWKR